MRIRIEEKDKITEYEVDNYSLYIKDGCVHLPDEGVSFYVDGKDVTIDGKKIVKKKDGTYEFKKKATKTGGKK